MKADGSGKRASTIARVGVTSGDPHVPGEEIAMASPAENIARLKDAYRRWDDTERILSATQG